MTRSRRLIVWVPLGLLGAFLVVRAIIEPFVIDPGNPATYHDDWGGPSYVGVLAVHRMPGILVFVALCVWLRRRRSG